MLLFFSKEVNIVLIFMFLCVIIMIINTKVKQKVKIMMIFEEKALSLHIKIPKWGKGLDMQYGFYKRSCTNKSK